MKTLAVILLAITHCVFGEQPGPGEPSRIKPSEKASEKPLDVSSYNLHFELQIIDAPVADTLPLIESMRDPAQMEKAVAKLHAMIAKRQAKLVSLLTLATKAGEHAYAEDINELRYPVEFEPARVAEKRNPGVRSGVDAKPGIPETPIPEKDDSKLGSLETLAALATTFETRNTGTMLEVQPTLNAETGRIDAQIAPQHVFFAGMEKHTVISDKRKSIVEQPRFETNKVRTIVSLSNNQRMLLGTFNASGTEGWMELFLLRVSIRPVE